MNSSNNTTRSPYTARGGPSQRNRMWHEHNKSKCYTAVTLGELLQHRHFTATGNINSRINDKKHETILTIDSESKTLISRKEQSRLGPTHTSHGDGRLGSHQMGLDPHPHRGRDRHPELHPTLRTTCTTTRRQNPTSQRSMEHLLMATRHADAFRSHLQRSQHRHPTGHHPTYRHLVPTSHQTTPE